MTAPILAHPSRGPWPRSGLHRTPWVHFGRPSRGSWPRSAYQGGRKLLGMKLIWNASEAFLRASGSRFDRAEHPVSGPRAMFDRVGHQTSGPSGCSCALPGLGARAWAPRDPGLGRGMLRAFWLKPWLRLPRGCPLARGRPRSAGRPPRRRIHADADGAPARWREQGGDSPPRGCLVRLRRDILREGRAARETG